MEKKLRIQLFDLEGRMIDDRMVTQDPEISKGPQLTHVGPMRIEFSFDSPDDIEKAKIYLDQLVGNIPLGTKKARKTSLKTMEDPAQREALLEEALTMDDQDELIKFLREKGFRFMMTDFLETFDWPQLNIKEKHLGQFQWMLLCQKPAKNPKSDKYDPMLIFGIQLLPEHNERIVVYLHGEYHKAYKIPVPEKPKEVFKKTNMTKFPDYMTHEEREKFRFELRQYEADSERPLSKFWKRWRPYVENLPTLSQEK